MGVIMGGSAFGLLLASQPVLLANQSFWRTGRSGEQIVLASRSPGEPVVLANRSSGEQVVQATQSFWHTGCSGEPVV